jgi:hypothetical protein
LSQPDNTCVIYAEKELGLKSPHLETQFRFNIVITPKIFSFEVMLQWVAEMKVVRPKVRAVWWTGKVFAARLLEELRCNTGRTGQTRIALSEAFHEGTVPVCTHCCPADQ